VVVSLPKETTTASAWIYRNPFPPRNYFHWFRTSDKIVTYWKVMFADKNLGK
jgi:hypothetical protein